MLNRMLGAARLSADTFEDVERDSSATIQALIVVIIVSLATGIGQLLSADAGVLDALVYGVIGGILSWAVWALLVMLVGTKILKTEQTEADWGQLARGTGFAQTPGILNIFSFVPILGAFIVFVALIWRFAAMVIAVRQCLDYTSTLRAFFAILLAFIPVAVINLILFIIQLP